MGSGTDNRDNQQNKMAGSIDRNIARELTNNALQKTSADRFKEEVKNASRPKTFKDLYPIESGWELEILTHLRNGNYLPYNELNNALGTSGRGAKEWVFTHYHQGVFPKDMAKIIKDKLSR
jgi:hypothetical protein